MKTQIKVKVKKGCSYPNHDHEHDSHYVVTQDDDGVLIFVEKEGRKYYYYLWEVDFVVCEQKKLD